MKKLIILLTLVLVANVALAEDPPVTFDDANLEAAVRLELGILEPTEIYPTDMLNLTYLDANNSEISDLTGLEYATDLTELLLNGNLISDITPLSGLTNLTDLLLYGNEISDITPVSGLINLTDLRLFANEISDISPVSGLTNLTWLLLGDNEISDITPVSGLTSLTWLSLSGCEISDISPVSGLTNLVHLILGNNLISDISYVSGLTSLVDLSLRINEISDISPVSGLTNLYWLDLYHNDISDISPLAGMTNLVKLYISANEISDISPLSALTNLTVLWLNTNEISDISPISDFTNLTFLTLTNNLLDCPAYDIYLPLIEANNPGLTTLTYDTRPEYCVDQPYIDVSPLTWDFGNVELGSDSSIFLTISNMGNSDLTVGSLDFTLGSDPEFEIELPSTPPFAVAPGDNVDIEVVFTPLAEQCYSADLNIVSDDAYKPVVTVNLGGCGIPVPPSKQIEEIIEFIKDSREKGSLVGVGSQPDKKIDVLVKMLEAVKDLVLIKAVDLEKACRQLSIILNKCDGQEPPPDFVEDVDESGATAELAGMIQDLMDDLGC